MDAEHAVQAATYGPAQALARTANGAEPAGPAPLVVEVRVRGRVFVRTLNGHALIGRRDQPRNIYPDLDLSWDDAVSRRHAQLEYRDGQYWIRDLRSTNGTMLNRLELTPGRNFPVAPGDELSLGEGTCLRVLQAPVPEYTSDPPVGSAAAPATAPGAPGALSARLPAPDADEQHVLQLIDELMAD